jgi:hypothetical protein
MTDQPNQDAGGIPYWPDTDAPPTCDALDLCVLPKGHDGKHETDYRRVSGTEAFARLSDASQEGRPTTDLPEDHPLGWQEDVRKPPPTPPQTEAPSSARSA